MRNPIIAQVLADLVSQEVVILSHIEYVRREFPVFWQHYTQGKPEYSFDKVLQELRESIELKDTDSDLIIEKANAFLSALQELDIIIESLEMIVNIQQHSEREKALYRQKFTAMKNIILTMRHSVEEKILPQPIPA